MDLLHFVFGSLPYIPHSSVTPDSGCPLVTCVYLRCVAEPWGFRMEWLTISTLLEAGGTKSGLRRSMNWVRKKISLLTVHSFVRTTLRIYDLGEYISSLTKERMRKKQKVGKGKIGC